MMFAEQFSWVPWNIVVPLSFLASFVASCFIVKSGRCESPVGTLIFGTVSMPIVIAALWPFILLYALATFVCWLIGAEASDSDTHGV